MESNTSRPFVITTNSIQWRDAEGLLLKMETFGDMIEVSWERFANTYQMYYLVLFLLFLHVSKIGSDKTTLGISNKTSVSKRFGIPQCY